MERTVIVFALLTTATCGKIVANYTNTSNEINNENSGTNEPEQKLRPINATDSEYLVLPRLENPSNLSQIDYSAATEPVEKDLCLNNTDERDNLIEAEAFRCDGLPNVGEALKLTPYIEEGRLEEARRASEVDKELFFGLTSYSGFLTVNETYDSNIFFWYFPVEKKLVNETPWIFWLQGGPGASSMIGVFDEIGPFKVDSKMNLVRNSYTWLQNHSIVFIENPVGTGFSFTNHNDGFVTDMATYTKHLYSTLKQFLQLFPELKTAPLYVTGESYAGKYVPALGLHIHKHSDEKLVNLQGLILGNAYVEPGQLTNITRSFYEFGMVVEEQVNILKPLADDYRADIAANRSAAAKDKFNSLIAFLLFLSNQKQAYNFLTDEMTAGKYEPFLERPEVKRALHVGNLSHDFVNITVNYKLGPDFLTSTRPMIEELLNEYRVLIYCGQLDQMLPCAVSSEHYRRWKWNYSDQFLAATRSPFILNNKLVGYFKTGGHLTEVLIRGGGHLVTVDQPATARELVTRWTHSRPLGAGSSPSIVNLIKDMLETRLDQHPLPPLI